MSPNNGSSGACGTLSAVKEVVCAMVEGDMCLLILESLADADALCEVFEEVGE